MIAIDMDMPRSCAECPCRTMVHMVNISAFCGVPQAPDVPIGYGITEEQFAIGRPSWCPLIELFIETSCGGTIVKYTE